MIGFRNSESLLSLGCFEHSWTLLILSTDLVKALFRCRLGVLTVSRPPFNRSASAWAGHCRLRELSLVSWGHEQCGPSIAHDPIIMLQERGNSDLSLIFCIGKKKKKENVFKTGIPANKSSSESGCNSPPPFQLVSSGRGPSVYLMDGLCFPLQILKSQGRKVCFSTLIMIIEI